MNKIISAVLCMLCLSSFAQEKYLEVSLDGVKTTSGFINNVHLIKNDETGNLSLFLEEPKTTYGFQYDEDLKQIAQLTSKGVKRKYKEIIGQASAGGKVRLIQKNTKGNKFASILYDFENQQTEEMEYDLDMSDQNYLQSYNRDGICYVFTIFKNTSILNKWTFTLDGEVTSEELTLEDEMKRNKLRSFNLYKLIEEGGGMNSFVHISKVENKLPNTLDIATEQSKMFTHENGFYWTLDENHQYTAILDFQLPDLLPKLTIVRKSVIGDANSVKTNSFISGDILAQIVSNSKNMNLVFKDLETQEVINEYNLSKDEEIAFKNGPILQEGSVYSFGSTRKFEKSSKFLRKIASDKNGIALFRSNNGYRAIIGGIRSQGGGGGFGMMGAMGGIPMATAGGVVVSFNPASFAYGSYGSTSSTRIESLFDIEFQHIEGELTSNVFDEIEILSGDWLKRADDVYLVEDFVLFGNYDTNKKLYTLYKFENK